MVSREHENGRALDDESAPRPRLLEAPFGMGALTERERNAWAVSWAGVTALQARVEMDLHRECGLTPFELHLLYVLAAAEQAEGVDGDLPMSLVAQRLDSSLSRLSHVVRRLEDREWLRRRPSPDDARVTLVGLRDAGRRRAAQSTEAYERIIRETLTGRLPEEDLGEVVRLWTPVLEGLGEHWLVETLSGGSAGASGGDAEAGGGPAAS